MKLLSIIASVLAGIVVVRAAEDGNWFEFDPKPDSLAADSPTNLRGLNEKYAGEGRAVRSQ